MTASAIPDDLPPAYVLATQCRDLPEYSCLPRQCEHVLERTASGPGRYAMRSRKYEYSSPHMNVDLGLHHSAFRLPAYGLDATVSGTVKFTGNMSHIERVEVKLEGNIIVDVHKPAGTVAKWYQKYPLVSISACLYNSAANDAAAILDTLCSFEIKIPSSRPNGDSDFLPPTSEVRLKNGSCVVQYSVTLRMTRRAWRSDELISIPILYVPKSSPTSPAVPVEILLSPRHREDSRAEDGITTSVLRPLPASDSEAIARKRSSTNVKRSNNTIHLSLPSDLCFTSGERIPFILTIACKDNPEIKSLLPMHIRVTLLRRIELWVPSRQKPIVSQDAIIGHGETESSTSGSGGMLTLRGIIVAGKPGAEVSWNVKGAAKVSYYIRATLCSPPDLQDMFPSVRHEEECRLVTDPFGRYQAELLATGGIPTLSLGLSLTPSILTELEY